MREQDSFELIKTAQGWTVGRFRALAELPDVAHGVTTRQAPLLTGDVREPAVIAGMQELAEALGLRQVAWSRQVHGGTVRIVGAGGFQGEADALVTAAPGLGVLGRSADCPLILAVGPAIRAIGGWVGYDWWIAQEWSLGVQLRYLGVEVRNQDYDWKGAADTVSIQFTALYH